jgi:16S rRNA (guanine527-N7)-methyltransferase
MATPVERLSESLELHAAEFGIKLESEHIGKLRDYYRLLRKWNDRLHLVAPCSPEEFATRHVLESLMLVRHLSRAARVADIGSGAGLPIIPCLIARKDIQAVLFESSKRKAVFLREVLKALGCDNRAEVVPRRFQATKAPNVEFITCRAIDRFAQLLEVLIRWSPPDSGLLLFAGPRLVEEVRRNLRAITVERVPNSAGRFLVLARVGDSAVSRSESEKL